MISDGGPYIGTGCGIITKDPETGAVNIGTYRVMVQDKNHVSVKMNMGKHGRLAFERRAMPASHCLWQSLCARVRRSFLPRRCLCRRT